MDMYAALGFPGAIGSVDGVHVPWEMCPTKQTALHKNGKDGVPTLSFNVTADHTRRIMAVAGSFPGTPAAAVSRAEPDAGGELHVRGVHARVVGRRSHTASAPAASRAGAGTPPSRPPKRPSSAQAPTSSAQAPKTYLVKVTRPVMRAH